MKCPLQFCNNIVSLSLIEFISTLSTCTCIFYMCMYFNTCDLWAMRWLCFVMLGMPTLVIWSTDLSFQDPLFVGRVLFDLLYFFFIIIIVLNLFLGVIIDTFAALRSEKQEKEDVLNNSCFICGKVAKQELVFSMHHPLWHGPTPHMCPVCWCTKVVANVFKCGLFTLHKNNWQSGIPTACMHWVPEPFLLCIFTLPCY